MIDLLGRQKRTRGAPPISMPLPPLRVMLTISFFLLLLAGCGGQQQAQQADPRLTLFHVLSSRIIMLDTQTEVDGTVQNTGKDRRGKNLFAVDSLCSLRFFRKFSARKSY